MTIIERFRYLGNSPTHERDLATMFTPIRLGVWFLFLNATLIFAIGGVFFTLSEYSASQWRRGMIDMTDGNSFQAVGLSDILTSVIFLSLSAFVTIFVPIRVVGPIMGPRMGRYFDQIVLSGISPVRYFVGKVLSQNVFLTVIAVAAMPYLVLCISLGGISVKYALLGIFVLAVYANVLALVTLLLSVFAGEIASIIITLVMFTAAFVAGLLPLAPNPAPFSPAAVFLAPLQHLMGHTEPLFAIQNIPPGQLQLAIFLATALPLALICIVWLVLGPLNCILQDNGTFGEVVLKGDSKKRGFMKRRIMLRLRSEISFFYENRAPCLKRWDFVLRWGLAEALFLLALVLPFGLLALIPMIGFNVYEDFDKVMVVLAFVIGLIWVFLNNAFFLKDLTTERLRHKGMEAGHIDLLFYFANLAMIAAAVSLFLSVAGKQMDETWTMVNRWQVSQGGITGTPPVWNLPGTTTGLCLFVFGFELHWFARWLSVRMWSRQAALALATVIFVAITILLPWVPFLLIEAGNVTGLPSWMYTLTPIIADVSYATAPFHCVKDYPYRALSELGTEGLHLMLGFHFSVALVWMLAFFRIRRGLTARDLN